MRVIQLKQFQKNRYYYGKPVTVRDFQTEQDYMNGKRHVLNRLIHGHGIVFGLQTEIDNDKQQIIVNPGVAIDPLGREIVVSRTQNIDFNTLKAVEDMDQKNVYLCLQYDQDTEDLVQTQIHCSSSCDQVCQYNRIRETYNFSLLKEIEKYPDDNLPNVYLSTDEPIVDKITEAYYKAAVNVEGIVSEYVKLAAFKLLLTHGAPGDFTLQKLSSEPVAYPNHHVYSNPLLYGLLRALDDRVSSKIRSVVYNGSVTFNIGRNSILAAGSACWSDPIDSGFDDDGYDDEGYEVQLECEQFNQIAGLSSAVRFRIRKCRDNPASFQVRYMIDKEITGIESFNVNWRAFRNTVTMGKKNANKISIYPKSEVFLLQDVVTRAKVPELMTSLSPDQAKNAEWLLTCETPKDSDSVKITQVNNKCVEIAFQYTFKSKEFNTAFTFTLQPDNPMSVDLNLTINSSNMAEFLASSFPYGLDNETTLEWIKAGSIQLRVSCTCQGYEDFADVIIALGKTPLVATDKNETTGENYLYLSKMFSVVRTRVQLTHNNNLIYSDTVEGFLPKVTIPDWVLEPYEKMTQHEEIFAHCGFSYWEGGHEQIYWAKITILGKSYH